MAQYVYLYTGGKMAETEQEKQQEVQLWGSWFGELGEALVEGGAPFGASTSVGADGAVTAGGAARISGYSVVKAESLDDATALSKGCPVLTSGGAVQIYEAIAM